MAAGLLIRAAAASDAPSLSVLVGELGYPADSAAIPARLAALEQSGVAAALVAELDGVVIGVATVHVVPAIHSSRPAALLTALVVAEPARGAGAGRALVGAAEEWARARGAVRIAVTSASHRIEAHEFYERIGYARTGVRLGRQL